MRTDGQTDMTNGTVAFHHFANVPKKDNELKIRKKKNQSRYRPGVAQRVPGS